MIYVKSFLVGIAMQSWAIGLAISFVIVALGIVGVHTPLQLVSFVFSIPLMPGLLLFDAVTRGSGMGERGLTVGLYASQVLFGSFAYGAVVFLVLQLWNRHKLRSALGEVPRL